MLFMSLVSLVQNVGVEKQMRWHICNYIQFCNDDFIKNMSL